MRKFLFCACTILTLLSVTMLIFQNEIEAAISIQAESDARSETPEELQEEHEPQEHQETSGPTAPADEEEAETDTYQFCHPPHTKDGIGGAGGFITDDPYDLELLARAIYAEAGGDECSDETRIMVGNVILNRMNDPRYPDTMEEVLTQPLQYNTFDKTGVVWKDRASDPDEKDAVERAYRCAERVLLGEKLLPDDVIFQSEYIQGTEIVAHQDGMYFCR